MPALRNALTRLRTRLSATRRAPGPAGPVCDDVVETRLDVRPPAPTGNRWGPVGGSRRSRRGPGAWAEAVGARLEVRLEDRLEHQLQRRLARPGPDGGIPRRRNVPPGLGIIFSRTGSGSNVGPSTVRAHPEERRCLTRSRWIRRSARRRRACGRRCCPGPVPTPQARRPGHNEVEQVIEPATRLVRPAHRCSFVCIPSTRASPPSATATERSYSQAAFGLQSTAANSCPPSPGSPGALLRPAPLRTGRARFRASGSSKPKARGRAEVLGRCRWRCGAAAGVYETEVRLRPTCRAPGRRPLASALPVTRTHCSHSRGLCGGWSACRSSSRTAGSAALPLKSRRLSLSSGGGARLAPPVGPVLGQGRVVRGRPALDHLVSDDLRPGELEQVGAAVAVAEHPPVLPGLVEPAEVPVDDPVLRLVRVAVLGPLVGELPQVAVQRGEHLAGHHRPVVGRPPPHDGVEPLQHRRRVGPAQGPHLGAEPFPDPSQGRLARSDQQLAVIAADGEPQEVEALVEVDDARLVLVEGQPPGRQPLGQPCLDLFASSLVWHRATRSSA